MDFSWTDLKLLLFYVTCLQPEEAGASVAADAVEDFVVLSDSTSAEATGTVSRELLEIVCHLISFASVYQLSVKSAD